MKDGGSVCDMSAGESNGYIWDDVFLGAISFMVYLIFFFSSRRRHTRCSRDWSSDVCSSDLIVGTRGRNPLQFVEIVPGVIDAGGYNQTGANVSGGGVSVNGSRDRAWNYTRSEERRGGEEWRSRWGPDH